MNILNLEIRRAFLTIREAVFRDSLLTAVVRANRRARQHRQTREGRAEKGNMRVGDYIR